MGAIFRFFTFGDSDSEKFVRNRSGKGHAPEGIVKEYEDRFKFRIDYQKSEGDPPGNPDWWTDADCEE